MSEFKFSDIIKPGQAAQQVARREMEARAGRHRYPPPGKWYGSVAEMVLKHGEMFGGRVLPDAYADVQGPLTHCHINALAAAQAHPELRLFTGYYVVGLEVSEHSWCVAPDGGVVETTYPTVTEPGAMTTSGPGGPKVPWMPPQHWAYFGLEFDPAFVAAFEERTGCLPVLFADDEPLFKPWVERALEKPYSKAGFKLPTENEVEDVKAALEARWAAENEDDEDEDDPDDPLYV